MATAAVPMGAAPVAPRQSRHKRAWRRTLATKGPAFSSV